MATAINYTSTSQTGKKLNKTVTNVNPNNTSTQLKTFAQMLNSLTTNHYGATTRIDKDELVAASSLTAPTFVTRTYDEVISGNIVWSNNSSNRDFGLATNSPGKIYLISAPEYGSVCVEAIPTAEDAAEWYQLTEADGSYFYTVQIGCPKNEAKCLGDFVFGIKAAEGFAPATFTITVSAS